MSLSYFYISDIFKTSVLNWFIDYKIRMCVVNSLRLFSGIQENVITFIPKELA